MKNKSFETINVSRDIFVQKMTDFTGLQQIIGLDMLSVYRGDIYKVTKFGNKLRATRDAAPSVLPQSD